MERKWKVKKWNTGKSATLIERESDSEKSVKKNIENVELLCPEYPCLGRPGPGAMVIMMTVVIKL